MKSTPRRAWTPGNDFTMPRQSSAAAAGSVIAAGSRSDPPALNRLTLATALLAGDLGVLGELGSVVLGEHPGRDVHSGDRRPALQLGHHRVHALVAHLERILDHEAQDLAILDHLVGDGVEIEGDQLDVGAVGGGESGGGTL